MIQESRIVNYLVQLDRQLYASSVLVDELYAAGFTNTNGDRISTAQMNSLVHSANQKKRKESRRHLETCGIDREANPCGDASDY